MPMPMPPLFLLHLQRVFGVQFDVVGAATVSGLPVWPQIYLCLRCGGKGDASAIAAAAAPVDASESSKQGTAVRQEVQGGK